MPTIEPPGRRPVSPQEAADINETGDELFEGQQAEGPVKPVEPHKQIPAARNPQLQHTPPNLHARSAAPTAAQQIPSSPEIREKYKQMCHYASAQAFMHAMQDPKGIQGQFKVVFVPDGGGSPIDVDPAQPGVDQSILINYQNQINQIRSGWQQILYGLSTQIIPLQREIIALGGAQSLMCPIQPPTSLS